MTHQVAIIVEQDGRIRVLTDSPDVHVLVVDRTLRDGEGRIVVDGDTASVDSLIEGIPRVDPVRVGSLFAGIGLQLGAAAAVPGIGAKGRAQLVNMRKSWFPPG